MFFFLSKLLPLFIYPLGLSCLLMGVALVLLWRKSRWAFVPITVALIVLLLASNSWVSNTLVRSLEWQHIPKTELPESDAIVVLGGSTRSAVWPRPMVDITDDGDRILYAAELYRQGKAPWVILSGGRVGWGRAGSAESEEMAQLLLDMGVPKSAMLQDPDSLNTYENAVNVRKILIDYNLRQVLLVTSAMHMPRSLMIFHRQGIDATPAPTAYLVTQQEVQNSTSSSQAVSLNLLPDSERLFHTTKAIKEYIGTVIYRLRGWL